MYYIKLNKTLDQIYILKQKHLIFFQLKRIKELLSPLYFIHIKQLKNVFSPLLFLYSIDTLISLATKKFGGEFNEKLFLSQLTYFADIDIVSTVYIKEKYSDDEIKAFLEKKVHDYIIKRF